MRLPKKVKVGPYTYQVKTWDTGGDDNGCYGDCSNTHHVIHIGTRYSDTKVRAILLHEILHAIWHVWTIEDEDTEERMIQTLTHGLLAVINDNPKLLAGMK